MTLVLTSWRIEQREYFSLFLHNLGIESVFSYLPSSQHFICTFLGHINIIYLGTYFKDMFLHWSEEAVKSLKAGNWVLFVPSTKCRARYIVGSWIKLNDNWRIALGIWILPNYPLSFIQFFILLWLKVCCINAKLLAFFFPFYFFCKIFF